MISLIPDESFKRGWIGGQKATIYGISTYLKGEANLMPSPFRELVNMLAVLVEYEQYKWHSVPVGPRKEPDPTTE